MITIEQAIDIIKQNTPKLSSEKVDLVKSPRRILAEDLHAPEPSPRFDNSAMDGYAARFDDIKNASPDSPVRLKVVGESQAGFPFQGSGSPGTCIGISTGAVMHPDYDTVVRVEYTESKDEDVLVRKALNKGKDIRYEGEEFRTGDLLLISGTRLTPRHVAILASTGTDMVTVYRKPRIAILVTGSELTNVSEQPGPGQIRDSNRLMLETAVTENEGTVVLNCRAADDLQETTNAIEECAKQADIVICAGGISVGPHDHVKIAAEKAGFREHFWKVKQKPGKPLYFADRGQTLLFGLPGNPASAYMSFCHYIIPLMGLMAGLPWQYQTISGILAEDIFIKGDRPKLLRVHYFEKDGEYSVKPVEHQGSHMISSIFSANGYIKAEPGNTLQAGSRVNVTLLP